MPDPREWHELVEDVPELRPTKRGGRRYLICNADVEDWWWCGGEDQAVREDTDVAHVLCRERAVQWLAERQIAAVWLWGTLCATVVCEPGKDEKFNFEDGNDDFDTCLRLAVDAVRAKDREG